MSKWKCDSCNCAKSVNSCVKMFRIHNQREQRDQHNNVIANSLNIDTPLSDTDNALDADADADAVENNDSSFLSENDENNENGIDKINKAKTMMKICEFIIKSKFEGMSDNDITEKSKTIFNSDYPFHFSNCLTIDQMLNVIDSYMFRCGGGRWRAAYNYPKDGDDITLHQQYGIAKSCGFFTFSIHDCREGGHSCHFNDYCECPF